LAEIWHNGRGPLWPQNIKNLQIGNSCNSFNYFLKFRTLAHISKMAANTTSGSGFNFRFVFFALDLVENEYNIEGVRWTLFEIFGAKVHKFKKNLNELQEFLVCKFLIFGGHLGALPLCQNSVISVRQKKVTCLSKVSDLVFFGLIFRPNFLRPTLTANISGRVRRRELKIAAKVVVLAYYRSPQNICGYSQACG